MDCKTANQMIRPYLDQELNLEETDLFLRHIKTCSECREELEIYFTVEAGIHNLNQDEVSTYDLKGLFEQELRDTQSSIANHHVLSGILEVVFTLAMVGLAVASMLQLRIWF
ncbi:MAG: zf-HC2 domain-containing protein [Lachnospiraceae bacterium]|nr:zf-HC2 domain-containing protein [Lachnospiraceae bacterium]